MVTLTQTEKITVIITTHYIEEARQAHVVGLMRHGRLLAENSPENLLLEHNMDSLEDVFLKLCMSDSSRRAAALAGSSSLLHLGGAGHLGPPPISVAPTPEVQHRGHHHTSTHPSSASQPNNQLHHRHSSEKPRRSSSSSSADSNHDQHQHSHSQSPSHHPHQHNGHHNGKTAGNGLKFPSVFSIYNSDSASYNLSQAPSSQQPPPTYNGKSSSSSSTPAGSSGAHLGASASALALNSSSTADLVDNQGLVGVYSSHTSLGAVNGGAPSPSDSKYQSHKMSLGEYTSTTMAVTWKNFTRLRRNIPVLLFQFALPAIQVILFCICIGADPFNIPVAIVNEEDPPFLSRIFLDKIDPYLVNQRNYSDFDVALKAVEKGEMWGVLHIPPKFSLSLQRR